MMLHCPNKMTFQNALIFILVLQLNYGVQISSETVNLNDLPLKSDLNVYLRTIERIIQFCEVTKNDLDLNLGLGLFLLNVNLKHTMVYNNASIPRALNERINHVFKATEALIKYFEEKAIGDIQTSVFLLSVLSENPNTWVRNTKEYTLVLDKKVPIKSDEQLEDSYLSWNYYMDRVNNISHSVPSPKQSDNCIKSLLNYTKKQRFTPYKCFVTKKCLNIIKYGSSYGYALTHRLLLLLIVRYGLGCCVYSAQTHDALITELCGAVYSEARYIALHGYRQPDLLMEQMGLCTLPGHAEFLQRRWLSQLLRFQSPPGCFSLKTHNSTNVAEEANICVNHMTAVAAVTFGAAVRYIVQFYY